MWAYSPQQHPAYILPSIMKSCPLSHPADSELFKRRIGSYQPSLLPQLFTQALAIEGS